MDKKMVEYFEHEYKSAKNFIQMDYHFISKEAMIHDTIERCLGVAMFAQNLGIPFSAVEESYYFYKEKLEKLLTKD